MFHQLLEFDGEVVIRNSNYTKLFADIREIRFQYFFCLFVAMLNKLGAR